MSEETRFCSRCGLPLTLIADVVQHGGSHPQLDEAARKKPIMTRRNGIWFSVIWCVFFVLLVTPFWAILQVEEMAAMSAVTGIFGGLILLITSLIFLKKPYVSYTSPRPQAQLPGREQQSALPPASAAFTAPRTGGWRDTNDLEPASVTESTTRLLDNEERR